MINLFHNIVKKRASYAISLSLSSGIRGHFKNLIWGDLLPCNSLQYLKNKTAPQFFEWHQDRHFMGLPAMLYSPKAIQVIAHRPINDYPDLWLGPRVRRKEVRKFAFLAKHDELLFKHKSWPSQIQLFGANND